MEMGGIIQRKVIAHETPDGVPIVDDVKKLGRINVALLCVPTLKTAEIAKYYLMQGVSVVDSFDIHGTPVWEHRNELDAMAREGNAVAITAAGWDPGIDSVIRAAFRIAVPVGLTYTNYGPGTESGTQRCSS